MQIKKIQIQNFKSIKSLDLKLNTINILIGANGAGKSNLISFFSLLNAILNKQLQNYSGKYEADNLLYLGLKKSLNLSGRLYFTGGNAYYFKLQPKKEGSEQLFFADEQAAFNSTATKWHPVPLGSGHSETKLFDKKGITQFTLRNLESIKVYHFHDTGENSPAKQSSEIEDNRFLRQDGGNLAAFLYMLQQKHSAHLKNIENHLQLIAPFFEKFVLEPKVLNKNKIGIEWKQEGTDKYFSAHHFSDGTLRMICLLTLLLQPTPPPVVIIDEPELGLHPSAIEIFSSVVKKAAEKVQLLIATQSTDLINHFLPDDIIVAEREGQESLFKRLEEDDLRQWKDSYSLGELWQRNIIGGRA